MAGQTNAIPACRKFRRLSSCLDFHSHRVSLPPSLEAKNATDIPDSPRWLINNNRREEALSTLHRIRPQTLVDEGLCELEVSVLENSETTHEKQPWSALFNAANRRRTGIALTIMALQQLTGVTFSSSYGTTFYKQVGLGSMAFTYAVCLSLSIFDQGADMDVGRQQWCLCRNSSHRHGSF